MKQTTLGHSESNACQATSNKTNSNGSNEVGKNLIGFGHGSVRDPKRIKVICELIEKAMMICSDIRFGQLLVVCGYLRGAKIDYMIEDPFDYEDDRLIECLQTYIKDHSE